ncbi:4-amino-4-deoxy-L-arabinose transferase-like glycosyltransferase [Actinoplanes octamycinicus]|uniref:4-amino-4-deoxy-L-arabinose transferase-like glycosyltransferase n=1 Tax=Actinoplanes octamycinicus TaxID=135948 RepID=A0A7W7H1W8_9ACTN|nr:hypothetical protein [Actinoplanes octamycinicus]MBB4742491.1 4-amino-4-deoxy-L-arabinose transferase-like glycosyltransferase [Actinoplanes octamycinicus]GIE60828.1 hypothetical protein Aoc01nite_62300 [Actinoplanes octamycinicus]
MTAVDTYALIMADADVGATYMYLILALWIFVMPFVMIGLGALSGGARTARTRIVGVVVSVLLMTWFVASLVIASWRGIDDRYFWSDVVGSSLCGLAWMLVPWLVTLLISGWRRRRAGRPGPVPDDAVPVVPDDKLP